MFLNNEIWLQPHYWHTQEHISGHREGLYKNIWILQYIPPCLSMREEESKPQLPMPSPHALLIHRYDLWTPVTDQQPHASSWLLRILFSFQEWRNWNLKSWVLWHSDGSIKQRGESSSNTGFLSWTYAFCPHRSWHVWCQPSSRGQAELLLHVHSQELSSTTMEGTHPLITSDHDPWYKELPMTF